MLKKIPVKKEYLLIAASVLLLVLSYQLAFKKTIEAWQMHRQLKIQLTVTNDLSVQPAYLERKSRNLRRILDLYQADTTALRGNMLGKIAAVAEKYEVKLSEVPSQDPMFRTPRLLLEKLAFEGDYFALTRVARQLQLTPGIGAIRSLIYHTASKNNGAGEIKKLTLEVYLEIAR